MAIDAVNGSGATAPAAGLNVEHIDSNILPNVQAQEQKMKDMIEHVGPNPTAQGLLSIQGSAAQHSVLSLAEAALVKLTADEMKDALRRLA